MARLRVNEPIHALFQVSNFYSSTTRQSADMA
jgi:hypothetical protein